MARTSPLTNTEVKQAKAKDKEYKLADGEGTTSLYLYINQLLKNFSRVIYRKKFLWTPIGH